ncbi:hypothetical protein ACOCJ4_13790 [Knoellia sp. CPCC 206435]|uniref:hypothetical protein n=1 Tax=Knoellia terrae TaxID=3404797 RepID=UPI003B4326DD
MTRLIELRRPKSRFARSINVERDTGSSAVEGYLPVGRAIEALDRLGRALLSDSAEVALSITGPYGSGKSSLALIIDGLFAPADDPARASAETMLRDAAPETMVLLQQAMERSEARKSGFIRAVVTAQREPVAQTVVRALLHGAQRFTPAPAKRQALRRCIKTLIDFDHAIRSSSERVESRAIRNLILQLDEIGPVLLVIDEFGKNLEAFAERPGEGDLFLLQELAEWTRRGSGARLALVTLQHMAFGDYADGASAMQRREWVKVQGRFEDIPFVDTAVQTISLVAASFEDMRSPQSARIEEWAKRQVAELRSLGLTELAIRTELIASCWPLHPLTLAVLPELCQRYGQNERTMFSFLAGTEPRSVHSFLRDMELPDTGLPTVDLDMMYDYFLESASNMVSVSADASRWMEIDTRIRDAHGLDTAARRVLKSVGLLNLISAGGSVRASREMVGYAASNGLPGTRGPAEVEARLQQLEAAGLVTYREFADEFRVWQGSDFDLKSAIAVAKRRLRDEPPRVILQRVLPLGPLVAARHSHVTGTLRAFERGWTDSSVSVITPLSQRDRGDGLLLYVLAGTQPTRAVTCVNNDKPVVFATTSNPAPLVDAARELAAIDEVIASDDEVRSDWVARKELAERRVAAAVAMDAEFETAFGAASLTSRWHWVKRDHWGKAGQVWRKTSRQSPSAVLSVVADSHYPDAPVVRNDLINRHELSSQAAKARREVMEVMGANEQVPGLGITGFGPDRTLYLSVLRSLGLHGTREDGNSAFLEPAHDSSVRPVVAAIIGQIRTSSRSRLNVSDLYADLSLPPYGLRAGLAPIVFVAVMRQHKDEFALYEHGTFRPTFSGDVAERLLRNPGNFEVKSFASGSGVRRQVVESLAATLMNARAGSQPTVVNVVGSLVARFNMLPAYAKKTATVSNEAKALRVALVDATEPDLLVFDRIPAAVGFAPIPAGSVHSKTDANRLAAAVLGAVTELSDAYPALVEEIRKRLCTELRVSGDDYRASLQRRAAEIADKVIDPRVKSLVAAIRAGIPQEEGWLEYVGMQVTGVPPQAWADEDCRRFRSIMAEAGGTFRRIEALNADMRSQEGEFDAVRFHVNWSHGHETVKLVVWDERTKEGTASVVTQALDALTAAAGNRETAADWLMAALADHEWKRVAQPDATGNHPNASNEESA